MTGKKIRVLVVDDSAIVRRTLSDVLSEDPQIEVMAAVNDPVQAVERIKQEVPDVITLDVEMPRMDGVTFLRRLMSQHPIPVVMCSSLVGSAQPTLHAALDAGAVDVICKPKAGVAGFLQDSKIEIVDAVKGAAAARLSRRALAPAARTVEKKRSPDEVLPPPKTGGSAMLKTTERIVVIGASTGGTQALGYLLTSLPMDCPPIAIVQHMPEAFTKAFADRLNASCAIDVAEAVNGDRLLRGRALIAPGGKHLLVQRSGAQYGIEIRDGPLVSRHRPSVDVLFRSTARSAGANAVGVIMTGMGDDGARGLREMREAGAQTIGENEESCVVYGMPRAAKLAGAVETEVHLKRIVPAILQCATA